MLKNFYQPTPKNFRVLGDMFLVLIPVVTTIIASAPNMASDKKYWWNAGCSIVLVLAKFATNLAKEQPSDNTQTT